MIKIPFKKIFFWYMLLGLIVGMLFVLSYTAPPFDPEESIFYLFIVAAILLFFTIPLGILGMTIVTVVATWSALLHPKQNVSKKKQRKRALHNHVEQADGQEIFVRRVGPVGTYLEHFLIHYRDSEDLWQVRHIIRNQMKNKYYWDDPIVSYKHEIPAKASQAKEQIINELDVEIHRLQQAIAQARQKDA